MFTPESQAIGGLEISEVISQPEILRLDAAPAAAGAAPRPEPVDPPYLFILQVEGSSLNSQDNRVAKLASGDFVLCATARPCEMSLPEPGRRIIISIPGNLLRRHLACPDNVVGVRMSGAKGMNMLLANFVRSFWACRREAVDQSVAIRMSCTLLDLIAAAYSCTPQARCEQSSLVAAHRVRIISYIEAHLRDPELTPRRVAQACRITARYLHHLFASESETVTQFIQRRRLEECARALIAAPIRGRLVTEIAFDYGFNSLTHFGRVFRNQYGLTPSEYRRAARD